MASEDYTIVETLYENKDDKTGEIFYTIDFAMSERNGDGTVLLKAEAEAIPTDQTVGALKEAEKECRIAGRFAFIHALEGFWKIEK